MNDGFNSSIAFAAKHAIKKGQTESLGFSFSFPTQNRTAEKKSSVTRRNHELTAIESGSSLPFGEMHFLIYLVYSTRECYTFGWL